MKSKEAHLRYMASFGDHPPLPEILEELLLDDSVSTVFLKAECKPRVKSGHISSLSLNELERELWGQTIFRKSFR